MSLDITVYCKEISKDLIPKIVERLNNYDMVVEIHPGFRFDPEKDSGFVPFKFQLKDSKHSVINGKTLISGFELYFNDFNLQLEKERLKQKPGLFNRLLRKKEVEVPFASPDIEDRLKDCTKELSFVWHSSDSFELRFASMTSSILTELTNGVCYYPADDIWYKNENIVDEAFQEAKEYENSLSEKELQFHEFEGWD